MKVAVFSTKPYDQQFLEAAAKEHGHLLSFFEARLSEQTVTLARGYEAVCIFVHDQLHAETLRQLAEGGTRLIALRCAGFNNVDLAEAGRQHLSVVRVPAYSPHAVAEHTVALMLALNRKIHKAYLHVREGDFSLDGLLGFDMYQKTVGLIGTGKIGGVVARILQGFGCRLLVNDLHENPEVKALGAEYVARATLFSESDIVSLHCPLLPETYHLVNYDTLGQMKPSVMLVNTSRGALVNTQAVIEALKTGKIGALGLDVYEEEDELFFEDLSMQVIKDDVFSRLLTFPNVIITGHQAFFTREALRSIAETTMVNLSDFAAGRPLANEVRAERRTA